MVLPVSNALVTPPDGWFVWLADSIGTGKLLDQHSESDFLATFDTIIKPQVSVRDPF